MSESGHPSSRAKRGSVAPATEHPHPSHPRTESKTIAALQFSALDIPFTPDIWRAFISKVAIDELSNDPDKLALWIVVAHQQQLFQESLPLAKRLFELAPDSERSSALLAITFLKLGLIDDAAKTVANYTQGHGDDSVTTLHLADSHFKEGDHEAAFEALSQLPAGKPLVPAPVVGRDEKPTGPVNEAPTSPHSLQRKLHWSDKHPVFVTCAFLAAAFGIVGGLISLFQFVRDDLLSPTRFAFEGNDVRLVNRDGKVKDSVNLSDRSDWTIYSELLDADSADNANNVLIGMGSSRTEENEVVLMNKRLKVVYRYDFHPDSPFPQIQKDVQLNSLRWVDYKGKRYAIAIFFGSYFPTAVVVLDDQLREVGRFWHPGHIYGCAYLDSELFFWGKNNTFLFGRDQIKPDPSIDSMTLNHVAVFALPFESISGINGKGPWLGPRGKRHSDPPTPVRPTAQPKFAFYYLLDASGITDQYIGPSLDPKPCEHTVVFTSHQRWLYEFGPAGAIGEPQPLPSHSPKAAGLLMVLPNDATGELQPPTIGQSTPIGAPHGSDGNNAVRMSLQHSTSKPTTAHN